MLSEKKPVGYVLYDSIYGIIQKRPNYRDSEEIGGCQRMGSRGVEWVSHKSGDTVMADTCHHPRVRIHGQLQSP